MHDGQHHNLVVRWPEFVDNEIGRPEDDELSRSCVLAGTSVMGKLAKTFRRGTNFGDDAPRRSGVSLHNKIKNG